VADETDRQIICAARSQLNSKPGGQVTVVNQLSIEPVESKGPAITMTATASQLPTQLNGPVAVVKNDDYETPSE
jgi:hypothetical protein